MALTLLLGTAGAAQAGTWGPPIATPSPNGLSGAALGPDGTATGVWVAEDTQDACSPYTTDTGCTVRAARLTAAGWSDPVTLSTGDTYSASVRVTADATGAVTVLWLQTDGTLLGASAWASRWQNDRWSPAERLSPSGLAIYYTALTAATDGTVVAAWSDSAAGDIQTSTFAGGRWSAVATVPDGGQTSDHIDALVPAPDGSFTMLVRRTVADRIGAARLMDGTWTDEGLITPTGRAAYGGTAIFTADGTLTATWSSLVSGTYVIESAHRTASGWQTPVQVSSGANHAQSALLALDPTGDVVAVWNEFNGQFENLPLRYAMLSDGVWSAPAALASAPGNANLDALIRDEHGAPVAVLATWDGSAWTSSSTVFSSGNWSTAVPLLPGAPWRGYSVTGTGWGAAIAIGSDSVMRFGTPPSTVRDVQAEAGDRSIRVRWNSPTPTAAPITRVTATAMPGGASCSAESADTCTISGLAPLTAYRIHVVAMSAFGNSPETTPTAEIRTLAGGAPPAVGRIVPPKANASGPVAIAVPVTAPAPGLVTLTGTTGNSRTARSGTARTWRCTVRVRFAKAGTRNLDCRLRGRARQQLTRGALRFAFHVTFDPADGSSSSSSTITATIPRRR